MEVSMRDYLAPIKGGVYEDPDPTVFPETQGRFWILFRNESGAIRFYFKDPVRLRQVVKELYEQVLKLEA